MSSVPDTRTIGVVGARGYVGAELLRLIEGHPGLEPVFVCSRRFSGKRVRDVLEGCQSELMIEDLAPLAVASRGAEVIVLALPNSLSGPYIEAFDEHNPDSVVIDLSADHRFDDAWAYGLPEHFRDSLRTARCISNPGCYATAMQLAIRPMLDLLAAPPHVFGVSGYSGAGMTPSDKNDPDRLRDNLLPYGLTGHVHEREATRHLDQSVCFMPHVAAHFRGITLTVSLSLNEPVTPAALLDRVKSFYNGERLVRVTQDVPEVRDIACQHHCEIGGFSVDEATGLHAVVIATIDNLLKGAATQAVQNINLACGWGELTGIAAPER